MPLVQALIAYARSSAFAALFATGAVVLSVSTLIGSSMVSPGHLAGAALAGFGLLGLALRDQLHTLTWRPTRGLFIGLFIATALGYGLQTWVYYWGGQFATMDVGVFADLIANFALRGDYRSSVLGLHGFADHFTPTLAAFAPLFLIEPSFLWLIAAKFTAALASAVLLYAIGREVLGPASRWLWVAPCLCLVHTVFGFAYLYQFQPNHLAPPLALAGFYFALRARWVALVLTLLVLFGLKEDQPLIGVCIGLFLIIERHRRRLGAALSLASVAIGLVIFLLAMPAFADGAQLLQHQRFSPLANVPGKLALTVILFATVGFLPLLHPRSLLWILPSLGAHYLSGLETMHGFRHHYQAVPTALLLVGMVYGLRAVQDDTSLWRRLAPRTRAFAAALAIALVLALNGMMPHFSARVLWPSAASREVIGEVATITSRLPTDRAVHAADDLLPHLVPHPDLSSFSPWPGAQPDWSLERRYRIDPNKPHVVVITSAPLTGHWAGPEPEAFRVIETLAATHGYRVEPLTPHIRMYWSTQLEDRPEPGP